MKEHIVPPVRTYVFCFFVPWRASNGIDEASWSVMVATLWWLCILLILCVYTANASIPMVHLLSATSDMWCNCPTLLAMLQYRFDSK